ncbi:hypothetical protein TNCV_1200831 [Trichonephila clavipes]|nr:hypothetical protein TNCV_1200831 [Trichonephila clavipes]
MIQSESLLPIPIPTTTTTTSPSNNLNTSISSLSTEIPPVLTTSNKFAAKTVGLSTDVQPSVPLSESTTTTSNSELSNTSKVPQNV